MTNMLTIVVSFMLHCRKKRRLLRQKYGAYAAHRRKNKRHMVPRTNEKRRRETYPFVLLFKELKTSRKSREYEGSWQIEASLFL